MFLKILTSQLLKQWSEYKDAQPYAQHLVSICSVSESKQFLFVFYIPLSTPEVPMEIRI